MWKPSARSLTVLYGALALVDSTLAGSERAAAHRARRVTKPLLMPTLTASLLSDPQARSSPLRTGTVVAQLAGWGGDVALLGEGTKPFLAGAGSFAVGHTSYIVGFRRHGVPSAQLARRAAPRMVAAAWVTTGPVLAVAAARQHKALGPAVLGYSATLSTMAASATGLRDDLPADARLASAVGAGLFLLSDTVLGVRKFVLREEHPRLESAVMATYTSAQFLLSQGAARAGR